MTHVFVAPHPDDVALSCGGLIANTDFRPAIDPAEPVDPGKPSIIRRKIALKNSFCKFNQGAGTDQGFGRYRKNKKR